MTSMQPVALSYTEEEESCFRVPKMKEYRKGGLMDIIMKYSPLFAYLCQVSNLDDFIDSDEFRGTCFVPCKEYFDKYGSLFMDEPGIDLQKARDFVLSSFLKEPMTFDDLIGEDIIPSMYRYSSIKFEITYSGTMILNEYLQIIKKNIKCSNGYIHIINGLIEPYIQ